MFIQIPVFITFFFAIRRFAYDIQPEEFLNGGILWFQDLSKSDPYWRFPLLSALCSYATSELVDATPRHHKGKIIKKSIEKLKDLSFTNKSNSLYNYTTSSFSTSKQFWYLSNLTIALY